MTDGDAPPMTFDAVRERVVELRDELRRNVSVEQGAWGVDGHTFAYEVALSRPLPVGGYVLLSTRDARRYLGQITAQRVTARPGPQVSVDVGPALGGGVGLGEATVTVTIRLAEGDGILLATVAGDGFAPLDRHATFDLAAIEEAPGKVVDEFITWSLGGGAGLDTGAAAFGTGDTLPLLAAKGFNRHTFLCGQSGSGKTYGLGVLLERLLLHTTINMVILDPNSDYVGLGDLLPLEDSGAQGAEYERVREHWARLRDRIFVLGSGEEATPFKVVFTRLTTQQQALVLALDPLRDVRDFGALRRVHEEAGDADLTLAQLLRRAEQSDDADQHRLAERVRNLGIPTWDVWATVADTPARDALPADHRVIIADLGGLELVQERSVLAAGLLDWLWRMRHERTPRLVVIDEAHNVCPQSPETELQALATDHVIRIAAEGRKYGLYLLLSTQQPQKIHANVLSQCDNLILLRMNSTIDTEHLTRVFGFVPPSLVHQAAGFRLGEGLVAGRISSHALRYQGARRWTREGGADVPTTWAMPGG